MIYIQNSDEVQRFMYQKRPSKPHHLLLTGGLNIGPKSSDLGAIWQYFVSITPLGLVMIFPEWVLSKFIYIKVCAIHGCHLEVRQIQNIFFKPTFLLKNERTNSSLPLVDLFSFVFWMKVKTPKRHFEIN